MEIKFFSVDRRELASAGILSIFFRGLAASNKNRRSSERRS
jgi:hypothetical protein